MDRSETSGLGQSQDHQERAEAHGIQVFLLVECCCDHCYYSVFLSQTDQRSECRLVGLDGVHPDVSVVLEAALVEAGVGVEVEGMEMVSCSHIACFAMC